MGDASTDEIQDIGWQSAGDAARRLLAELDARKKSREWVLANDNHAGSPNSPRALVHE